MTTFRFCALRAVMLLVLGSTATAHAQEVEGGLQPFQMVRSLQLVQDRIAGGDHAALPMQKKLLEIIDARFRKSDDSTFKEWRNFQALMIYAMSGGNPSTIAETVERLEISDADRAVVDGVLGYLTGDVARARTEMTQVDPAAHSHELAAFLALVKGSVVASDDAHAGMAMLDRARLLGPGTLVEEAALRRTISLAVAAGDGEKFVTASEQYARRFLRSPYSAQFAEAFVSGIIELKQNKLDMSRIEATIDWMTLEQAKTVYLRLARRAAVDGDSELLAFASRKARDYADTELGANATRSELYSSISSVTSETVEDVLSRLQKLDSARLSASDRALLNAAKAVAAEVVAPVGERAAAPMPPREPDNDARSLALLDGDTATEDLLVSARSKLEAIDKLLEETEQ